MSTITENLMEQLATDNAKAGLRLEVRKHFILHAHADALEEALATVLAKNCNPTCDCQERQTLEAYRKFKSTTPA